MGLPTIPTKTGHEAFTDVLESIALEETGIAHLLNAEGEKLQAVASLLKEEKICAEEAIELQQSVVKVIQTTIKMQILLEFKLETTLDNKIDFEGDAS